MSYNEYIPSITDVAKSLNNPKILEIGIDKGQFLFPMFHNLVLLGKSFELHEVDIFVRPEIEITIKQFVHLDGQILKIFQQNSLDYLKSCKEKYDIVMIDGDHNYYTVSNELEFIHENNSHDNTLIFCDDATTKWSNQDLYYANRDEYADNSLATKPQTTEKHGVGTAIEDFLAKHPVWKRYSFIENGSVILSKSELHA